MTRVCLWLFQVLASLPLEVYVDLGDVLQYRVVLSPLYCDRQILWRIIVIHFLIHHDLLNHFHVSFKLPTCQVDRLLSNAARYTWTTSVHLWIVKVTVPLHTLYHVLMTVMTVLVKVRQGEGYT